MLSNDLALMIKEFHASYKSKIDGEDKNQSRIQKKYSTMMQKLETQQSFSISIELQSTKNPTTQTTKTSFPFQRKGKSRTLSSLSLWCDPEDVPRQADLKTLWRLDLLLRTLPEQEGADGDGDGDDGGELLDDLLPLDPIPPSERRFLLHGKRREGAKIQTTQI